MIAVAYTSCDTVLDVSPSLLYKGKQCENTFYHYYFSSTVAKFLELQIFSAIHSTDYIVLHLI